MYAHRKNIYIYLLMMSESTRQSRFAHAHNKSVDSFIIRLTFGFQLALSSLVVDLFDSWQHFIN